MQPAVQAANDTSKWGFKFTWSQEAKNKAEKQFIQDTLPGESLNTFHWCHKHQFRFLNRIILLRKSKKASRGWEHVDALFDRAK